MRVVFVKTAEAKARLKPCLSEGNVDKTMKAPATAIVAYDTLFYDLLPRLFPQRDFRSLFAANEELARVTAFRNGSIQGGYFIIAARALGLDCGPMSGFDNAKVDAEFFPDGRWKSNFLCNLGYGDASKLHPRAPRARRAAPVVGGEGCAASCVTHSPESQLFELRAGLGGPTPQAAHPPPPTPPARDRLATQECLERASGVAGRNGASGRCRRSPRRRRSAASGTRATR